MSDFKRLNLETIKRDDTKKKDRLLKGLLREIATALGEVPYSAEGTEIHQNIFKNILIGSALNRNEITTYIHTYYPDLKVNSFSLQLEGIIGAYTATFNCTYKPTGEKITATAIT
jgi:pantothenate kinase